MSADMMLVCKSRDEYFDGKHSDKCICIDETSMGSPHTDFGKMFAGQFAGFFGAAAIDDELIGKAQHWYDTLEHKDYLDIDSLIAWLKDHKGEPLAYECW